VGISLEPVLIFTPGYVLAYSRSTLPHNDLAQRRTAREAGWAPAAAPYYAALHRSPIACFRIRPTINSQTVAGPARHRELTRLRPVTRSFFLECYRCPARRILCNTLCVASHLYPFRHHVYQEIGFGLWSIRPKG